MPILWSPEVEEISSDDHKHTVKAHLDDGDEWSDFNITRSRSQSATTQKRKAAQARTHEILTDDVGYWLQQLIGLDYMLTSLNFWDECKNGVYLIKLLEVIQKKKIKAKSAKLCERNNFFCIENVNRFLKGIDEYVIPSTQFQSTDLVERSNEKQVITCLLQLAKYCGKHGILEMDQLPDAARFELEIEAQEEEMMNSPVPIVPEPQSFEEPSEDEEEEEEEVERAPPTVMIMPEPEIISIIEKISSDNTKDDDNEETMSQEEMEKMQRKARKRSRKSVRFVPQKDSPIDTALNRLLNNEGLNGQIDIKRIKPGCFIFGSSNRRYYVRELRNVLMVRVGGGWEDLHTWLLRKIEEEKNKPPVRRQAAPKKRQPRKVSLPRSKTSPEVGQKRSPHTTPRGNLLPKSNTIGGINITLTPSPDVDSIIIGGEEIRHHTLSVSDVSADESGEAGSEKKKTKKKKRKKLFNMGHTTRQRHASAQTEQSTLKKPATRGHHRVKSENQIRMLERQRKREEEREAAKNKKKKKYAPRAKTTRAKKRSPEIRQLAKAKTERTLDRRNKDKKLPNKRMLVRNVSNDGTHADAIEDMDLKKLEKLMKEEQGEN